MVGGGGVGAKYESTEVSGNLSFPSKEEMKVARKKYHENNKKRSSKY